MKGSRASRKRWQRMSLVAMALLSIVVAGSAWAGGSAESFYDFGGIDNVLISPNGHWIAASAHRVADSGVLIQRVGGGEMMVLARSKGIGQVAWEAPDTLMYEAVSVSGLLRTDVAHLDLSEGKIVARVESIPAKGSLVDALPTIPDQVLWQFQFAGWTSLHRI